MRSALLLTLGLIFAIVGAALASNYRSVTTRHVALSMRLVRPMSPLRRERWTEDRWARRLARFVAFERVSGIVFGLFGVAVVLVVVLDSMITS